MVAQNGWYKNMDDLGVPPFMETTIWRTKRHTFVTLWSFRLAVIHRGWRSTSILSRQRGTSCSADIWRGIWGCSGSNNNVVFCTGIVIIVGCTSSQGHLVSHQSMKGICYVCALLYLEREGEGERGRENEWEMGKKEPTLIGMQAKVSVSQVLQAWALEW